MRQLQRILKGRSPEFRLAAAGFLVLATLAACSVTAAVAARQVKARALAEARVTATPTVARTSLPTPYPTPTATLLPTPTSPPRPTATRVLTATPARPTPTPTLKPLPADWLVPQGCGMTDKTADYGGVGVGTVVILGRQRSIGGSDNWSKGMDAYAGRRATVTKRAGVDRQGCPGVRVDVDGGKYFWRVRDLTLP